MERQVRHSCENASLRNLELFKKTRLPPKVSELAARKWKGNTLSCVPGQLNQAV